MATPDQLARSLFPVGELTKDRVRDVAGRFGLRVATKPDSYDVCFIPDGDTAGYLAGRLPAVAGPIVDLAGRELGRHDGVWRFTIGQRRGLGLGTHERRFVVDLRPHTNTVVVGPRESLACRWIDLADVTWTVPEGPTADRSLSVQLRAHGRPLPARLEQRDGSWRVHLDEPAHGVARGQSAVLYDGGLCLGGGRISRADRPTLPSVDRLAG
jgi:tRNA-specific 2-thiouridylase